MLPIMDPDVYTNGEPEISSTLSYQDLEICEVSIMPVEREDDLHSETPILSTDMEVSVFDKVESPLFPESKITEPARNQNRDRAITIQQAVTSWHLTGRLLQLLILHPGSAASLDDKIGGIEVLRHIISVLTDQVITNLRLRDTEFTRQRINRHLLPVIEAHWLYLFKNENLENIDLKDLDNTILPLSKTLKNIANFFSCDPEISNTSNPSLDLILTRLSCMTSVNIELQKLFRVIEKYSEINASFTTIFYGDREKNTIVLDIFKKVEDHCKFQLDGVSLDDYNLQERSYVEKTVLNLSNEILLSILRCDDVIRSLSQYAKDVSREDVLMKWISSQYKEWTDGIPSLKIQIIEQLNHITDVYHNKNIKQTL